MIEHYLRSYYLISYRFTRFKMFLTFKFCSIHDSGHEDVARLLIKHGADVNARDGDEQTPIELAVLRGNLNSQFY